MRSLLETAKLVTSEYNMLPNNIQNFQEIITKTSEQILFSSRLGRNHSDIFNIKKPFKNNELKMYSEFVDWARQQNFTVIEFEDFDSRLISLYW